MKVMESARALATRIDFSSGDMYRWCGSLPVGMRLISRQVVGSITLTSASREFRTNTGAGWAAARPEARRRMAASEARQENRRFTANRVRETLYNAPGPPAEDVRRRYCPRSEASESCPGV